MSMGGARANPEWRQWNSRHNLLFAREGDPLPDLTISRADDDLALFVLAPDSRCVDSRYPVRFAESIITRSSRSEMRETIARLLDAVHERLESCDEAEAREYCAKWTAIRTMSREDRLLRERAAALGLDGDDPDVVDDDFANELVHGLAAFPPGLVDDMLGAPGMLNDVRRRAAGVRDARQTRMAEGTARILSEARDIVEVSTSSVIPPHSAGWELARRYRERILHLDTMTIGMALDNAMDSTSLLHVSEPVDFRDEFVRGWVAANATGKASVALPKTGRTTRRFLRARAICLALLGRRERLITNAAGYAQSVSRAFATELLVPAKWLMARLEGPVATSERLSDLAMEADVHPIAVTHQVENHRMSRVVD